MKQEEEVKVEARLKEEVGMEAAEERSEMQMQIYEDSIGQYSRQMDEVDGFFYSDE